MDASYDITIIGAGPGGYVAAIRAAQMGARVALVESGQVGGTCLNRGCIPTKALAASAEAFLQASQAKAFGVETDAVTPNYGAMQKRASDVVQKLTKGVNYLLNKNKVEFITGKASFINPKTLAIDDGKQTTNLTSKHVIIATGSKPLVFPSFAYDGERVITSDEVLNLQTLPNSLVIIGGGVIGCEYASIFAALGTKVTVIEALPAILPSIDDEITRLLTSYLRRRRVDIHTNTRVSAVQHDGAKVQVLLEGAAPIACDLVMLAVGRRAHTTGLNLEAAGVAVNKKGEVIVDAHMKTSAEGVYAIGDVTGTPWKLAHMASRQGVVAVENILGQHTKMNYNAVPAAVFTDPEIATVGLSTQAAQEAGIEVTTAKFPFMACGKALASGQTAGFVKVVAEKQSGKLLGAHIIGPQASVLIAEATLALQQELTAKELETVIHAHPTLPEAFYEAVAGIEGLAIHI